VRAAVEWVQRAPYCILLEENVGRVRQILVDENGGGRVMGRRDGPQLLVVAAELRNELWWISGGG
jgi:hypothetical protein